MRLRPALDTELGPQCRLHVNLGEHAETLGRERASDALRGVVELDVETVDGMTPGWPNRAVRVGAATS
jgi:hypothetical protein